jgi:hypothetical protein
MPLLKRLPADAGQPHTWRLELGETPADESAHAALEALLDAGHGRTTLTLDPGGDAHAWRVELCAVCPILKWRASAPGVLDVSVSLTTLKALAELWELVLDGGGEYSFELLDLSAGPNAGVQTFLTLAPRS